jgi:hypothetical protein
MQSGDELLTWNPELAVETGIPLLPFYEMSEFSFFRGLSERDAARLRVLTPARVRADLALHRATIICLTERHSKMLENSGLQVAALLAASYEHVRTFRGYGQFVDTLDIYLRRDRPGVLQVGR